MDSRTEFTGTPTELSEKIDPDGSIGITPKKAARLILQNATGNLIEHVIGFFFSQMVDEQDGNIVSGCDFLQHG